MPEYIIKNKNSMQKLKPNTYFNIPHTRKVLFEKFSEEISFEEQFVTRLNKCKIKTLQKGFQFVKNDYRASLFEMIYEKQTFETKMEFWMAESLRFLKDAEYKYNKNRNLGLKFAKKYVDENIDVCYITAYMQLNKEYKKD